MNSRARNRYKINAHKQSLAIRHKLIIISSIIICFCVFIPLLYYLYISFHHKADITLTADNLQIKQGEALPDLLTDVTYEGDEKVVLDRDKKLTAKDVFEMLKSGKGYEISCDADPDKEGTYPIQLTLSPALKKNLESKPWSKKLTVTLKNGKLTVKNPIGEWDSKKFKRYDGTYVTDDFITSKEHKYYFDSDGNMVTGWQTIGNSVYHFSDDGIMDSDTWEENNGDRYYLGKNGAAITGWNDIDGNTYYFDAEGKMATGTVYIGLSKCKFDSFGKFLSKKSIDIDPSKPSVALTFDDGPGPRTSELLDVLDKYSAHATFFMLGQNIASYPDVLKKMDELGCELGNHSYDHADLSKLSSEEIQSEINKTNDKISNAAGSNPTVMRPPYGAISDTMKSTVTLPMILWNIDTLDWKTRNTQSTIDSVMSQAKDGDIILMHDIHTETVDAAIQLIPKLQEKGFQLVTVSELAAIKDVKLKNGETYTDF